MVIQVVVCRAGIIVYLIGMLHGVESKCRYACFWCWKICLLRLGWRFSLASLWLLCWLLCLGISNCFLLLICLLDTEDVVWILWARLSLTDPQSWRLCLWSSGVSLMNRIANDTDMAWTFMLSQAGRKKLNYMKATNNTWLSGEY